MEDVKTLVSVAASICAIVFGYVAFFRNRKTEDKEQGKEGGVLFTEIGYVKSGIDDIKRHQEKQDQQHVELIGRITRVEESAKQAHKRIDNIEN